jgi:molybdopterin/thiamine biosynthesis adenylyltransferase
MKPAQIFLYDDDVVETVNLSGQLYSSAMVGRTKVDAMALLARDFSMYYGIVAVPQRFTETTPAGDIMICGFDNMVARNIFFNAWVNHLVEHPHPERCLFIDGRLNMEEFQVFCIKGDDTYNIKRYNTECMFNDYQAESVQCSMKQTTYCSNMIGSIIVNLFTNFIANTLNPVIERDLPFKTYYDAGMMYFKTET